MTTPDDEPIYPRYNLSAQRFPLRSQMYGLVAGIALVLVTVATFGAGLILYAAPLAALFSAKWRGLAFAALSPALAFATVGPGYLLVQHLAGR